MPKVVVINMQENYPFFLPTGQPQYPPQTPIIVKQSWQVDKNDRTQLLSKATFAKNLRNKNLVKI